MSDTEKTKVKKEAKKGTGKKKGAEKATSKKTKAPKEKAKAAPKKEAVAKDNFGFRVDSYKSKAAALYSNDKGATLAEVKDATGSSQLNLLKELEEKGHKVTRSKEDGEGKRKVTRYKLSKNPTKGNADKKASKKSKAKAEKAEEAA